MLKHLGDWAFAVFENEDGSVFTDWTVYDPSTDYAYEGTTQGAFPWAVLEAYDHIGINCPLFVDPDLAALAGLDPRKEDA